MNTEIESIIRHSLGLDNSGDSYRNRYCSDANDALLEAVELGLMSGPRVREGLVAPLWYVTELGAESVGATLPVD